MNVLFGGFLMSVVDDKSPTIVRCLFLAFTDHIEYWKDDSVPFFIVLTEYSFLYPMSL